MLFRSVPERVDDDGSVHRPIDLDGLGDALETFAEEDVEAVAVAFLNSYANDEHERAAAEAVRTAWPDAWVTTSAAVSPLMGEYERTSTAVINAALMPRIVGYLLALEDELSAEPDPRGAGKRHHEAEFPVVLDKEKIGRAHV